jgi:4-hydroxymandelate oxidase
MIERAEAAGYSALILTVDTPVLGLRRRDARNDFHRPADVPFANLARYGQADLGSRRAGQRASSTLIDTGRDLTWDDVAWLIDKSSLPLLLKGVLTAEDAVLAKEAGVSALVISNHGGRQLDHAPATLDVLPEIRAAVGDEYPLIVDGGVRQAADILIAVALGANAVGIGRPALWALACGGPELLQGMLSALVNEIRRQLVQIGARSVTEVGPNHVRLAGP